MSNISGQTARGPLARTGSPRRVLITTDTVGGVLSYTLTLTKGLTRRGISVAVATMGAPLATSTRDELEALDAAVFEGRFRLEWMDDPWDDVDRAEDWLLDVEQRFDPDLVHLNQYCFGALPWKAPTVVVAHSCVLSWWRAVHGVPAPDTYAEYRRRTALGLRHASAVVAPSQWMLDSLSENYDWHPRRHGSASIIYNGCDPGDFVPARKQPFILAAGRLWDEAKNLTALDRVASRLPWPVRIAGNPRAPERLDTTPLEHACPLGVLSQQDLRSFYARASIYALPARYEPFGLSILEAALSQCALILGDIPSLREIWQDCAAYVPPCEDAAILSELTRLIRDPSKIESLGLSARRRAQSLTADSMTDQYLALYREQLSLASALVRRNACA